MGDARFWRRTDRTTRFGVLTGSLIVFALALSGCATEPDAGTTRDSISQVTKKPEKSKAAEKLQRYDAALHPDPIAEPRECTPYLTITARGTNERSGNQLLTPVARLISESRPGEVDTLDLDYPADTDVRLGSTRAVRLLIDTLEVQTRACPVQRFVLLGYSQGALAIGDALAAPGKRLVGEQAGKLTAETAQRILAVVLYGDPRFLGTEPYDSGDFDPKMHGVIPRPAGSLKDFELRLRDYCVAGDIVCQGGPELKEEGHVAYFSNGMQQDGAAFVIGRLFEPGALGR
ncbi:MAG: cutinase family protein [Actinobacteria bacterium]|nr:cutinase family protein [Actinomycetota bacterium]